MQYRILKFVIGLILFISLSHAWAMSDLEKFEYAEEIVIEFSVNNVGHTIIPAVLVDFDIYLSIQEVFDFLKIKATVSNDLSEVSGFFIHEKKNIQ